MFPPSLITLNARLKYTLPGIVNINTIFSHIFLYLEFKLLNILILEITFTQIGTMFNVYTKQKVEEGWGDICKMSREISYKI